MHHPAGTSIPLSQPRRLICDYLHFARKVPSVPAQRRLHLSEVVAARAVSKGRPGWCAIFTKAYAIVTAGRPQFRRAYLPFPWPRFYEHPINMTSVAIERKFGDEDALIFGHVRQAEELSLIEIDRRLQRLKEQPLESIGNYRRILLMDRLPRPLRRLLWWITLNVWGRKRAAIMGTAGVTGYAGFDTASLHPLSLLTTTLNYDAIESDGSVLVRIIYDHRVMDGATAAGALAELERVLTHEILTELRQLSILDVA